MPKVHVICRDWVSDRIIPRLAKMLVDGTGWSIGPGLDEKADANLAFPYLEAPQRVTGGTKLIAEFSHYESTVPAKAREWTRVANLADLRLTWAKQYQTSLSAHGLSMIVTPPLDREKFALVSEPRAFDPAAHLRLGVSGWVYKGGRKGEHLVKRLVENDARIVATGHGWPCEIVPHQWADMQDFYYGLDAYLCTSLIEGIPYPPLEALACGIPVIVPTGVGMMDELPRLPGIVHYEAGNYDDLNRAIERLTTQLRKGIDRDALRATTERFTLDAWIADHVAAVERLLAPPEQAAERSTVPKVQIKATASKITPLEASQTSEEATHGIYLVAYGEPALACLGRAIASIRTHMPNTPICVASLERPEWPVDFWVERADTDIGARGAKTEMYDLTPANWESILYLDADTELVGPVDSLFAILNDGWDIIVCPNPVKYALMRDMIRPDNKDECAYTFDLIGSDELIQYNGGVFGFRRSESTAALVRGWHAEWSRYGKRDQAALDRKLYEAPVKVWTLSSEFNRIDRYDAPTPRTAIVHHPTKARRHTGRIEGRLDSDEAWMRVGMERRRSQ